MYKFFISCALAGIMFECFYHQFFWCSFHSTSTCLYAVPCRCRGRQSCCCRGVADVVSWILWCLGVAWFCWRFLFLVLLLSIIQRCVTFYTKNQIETGESVRANILIFRPCNFNIYIFIFYDFTRDRIRCVSVDQNWAQYNTKNINKKKLNKTNRKLSSYDGWLYSKTENLYDESLLLFFQHLFNFVLRFLRRARGSFDHFFVDFYDFGSPEMYL